jgi:hypothetical protein
MDEDEKETDLNDDVVVEEWVFHRLNVQNHPSLTKRPRDNTLLEFMPPVYPYKYAPTDNH